MPLLNSTDVKIIRQYQQGNFTDIIELINYYPGVEPPKILPKEDVAKNISGKIVKEGDNYVIYYNDSHPLTRQRFTMAHEFAHLLLHKDCIGDGIEDDALYRSTAISSKKEEEANELAAEILMPWHLIVKAQDEGIVSIIKLAERLQVSRHALAIRLGVPIEAFDI